jgi:CBS domain-containing protein
MTANPATLPPDATVHDALELFNRLHCRHMPVVDGDGVIGMLSIRDVSAWLVEAHREEAEQLKQYISGGYSSFPPPAWGDGAL